MLQEIRHVDGIPDFEIPHDLLGGLVVVDLGAVGVEGFSRGVFDHDDYPTGFCGIHARLVHDALPGLPLVDDVFEE